MSWSLLILLTLAQSPTAGAATPSPSATVIAGFTTREACQAALATVREGVGASRFRDTVSGVCVAVR
jgi:hypothetical protein